MKKLLIIALLVVGCGRYETMEKSHPNHFYKTYQSRFDKWFGEKQWLVNGEWMTEQEYTELISRNP